MKPLLGKLACLIVTMRLLSLPIGAQEVSGTQRPSDLAEKSLEELMEIQVPKVYGASKLEQKTTEAPSSVSVVTADEIKRYGYRTLAEVLQSVQGMYVSYDRNYAFLGVRGINLGDFNGRVLLLVDGHRVNNNLRDGALIETAFILDTDLIDRVEVIRGPGAALYGNNAFFGVINVITRRGAQMAGHGAEGSGEVASFDTYKGRVTYGNKFKSGVDLLLSGTIYDSEGQDRLYFAEFDQRISTNGLARNNGVAENLDGDYYKSGFGAVRYQGFTLEGAFIRREKANPTAQYGSVFNDPRLRTTDDQGFANLKFAHEFPNVVDLTAQVYYDRSDFTIGYPQGFLFTNNLGTNVLTAFSKEQDTGQWWGGELQANKRFWDRHVITVGAEYRDDFVQEQRFEGQTTVHSNRQSYGVYVQGDFEVFTNLHFIGGGRYDRYGDFDPTANPRLALVYHPLAQSTVKAIYGRAFRAPNFLEFRLSGGQDLKPEEITAYELVYEQGLGRNLRSSISGFYNQMDDLLVFENGRFQNFDADAKGLEAALEGIWTGGIRGRVSYTFQDTENRTANQELPDSPRHLFKCNLSVPVLKDKLFAGLEFQYTSTRHTVRTTGATFPPTSPPQTVPGEDVAGFGIVNFTLFSQNLVKNLELSASIYNLLDRAYSDPASRFHQEDAIERDGRSFRVKLTYRF